MAMTHTLNQGKVGPDGGMENIEKQSSRRTAGYILRWETCDSFAMPELKLPTIDFLGIGAQRAATTWLDARLRLHPAVWMPPLKELHYFDRFPSYPSPSHLACEHWQRGLFGSRVEDKEWRAHLARSTAEIVQRSGVSWKTLSDLRWLGRYMFRSPKDDDWYRSLFAAGSRRVKGEITPAYSLLDEPTVAHIAAAFPGIRVIFIIRNPVDRALSILAFNQSNGFLPRRMTHSDMIGFLNQPIVTQRKKGSRHPWSLADPFRLRSAEGLLV